jgi:hypothetical protein
LNLTTQFFDPIQPPDSCKARGYERHLMTATGDVFILGIASTPAGRFPDQSFFDLCRNAVIGVGEDAGFADLPVERVWFSSVLMDFWGQRACRGQEVLTRCAMKACCRTVCASRTWRPAAPAGRWRSSGH